MPQFEIKEAKSVEIAKITFHKENDYKAIELNGKVYLEHVVLADRLIKKGSAKEAKSVKLEARETESVATPVKK